MKDLVIIGAGGFGREVASMIVEEINKIEPTWNFLGFIDDGKKPGEKTQEGYTVLGNVDYLLERDDKPYFAIAIANSDVREHIACRCKEAGLPAATLIRPSTKLREDTVVGEGSIICRTCEFSINVRIGAFCIINDDCWFGHDIVVDDYCGIMSHLSSGGDSYIGKHNYFGLRCTIINQVKTTDHCTFGACSCIVKDATVPGTYVGVPAKLIKPLNK